MRRRRVRWSTFFLSTFKLGPYPKDLLLSQRTRHILSFEVEDNIVKGIEMDQLTKRSIDWSICYRCKKEQLCWCKFFQKTLQSKVRQMFYDKLSSRNWKARNQLSEVLWYHCLLWTYVTHTENQRSDKTRKVIESKFRLLRKWPEGTWNFSHWRRTSVSPICGAGLVFPLLPSDILASANIGSIFSFVIVVDVLQKYME